MVKSLWNFISYWYFRYLLVTELYMVEKWERAMFHIVIFIILSIISLFNTTVILNLVAHLTKSFYSHEVTPDVMQGINSIQGEL